MSTLLIWGFVCLGLSIINLLFINERVSTTSNIRSAAVSLFILVIAMHVFSTQRDYVLKQQNAEIIQLLKADTPSTLEANNGR